MPMRALPLQEATAGSNLNCDYLHYAKYTLMVKHIQTDEQL